MNGSAVDRNVMPNLRMARQASRLALLLLALSLSACVSKVVKQTDVGNAHFAREEYDEALTAYRQAQVVEPDLAEPYYNAANAYNRQGQVDGALAQTEQALKTAQGTLAAQAWYNLGNAYFDAQQWDQAIEAYKSALRLSPTDRDAKHNLELAQQYQQQAQQQQQGQGDQQNRQNQGEGQQSQSENQTGQTTPTPTPEGQQAAQATPTPEGQQNQPENQAGQPTPTPESQAAEGQDSAGEPTPQADAQAQEGEMTPEQAQQLLMTLLGDSETLQEKLREIHKAPGAVPSEDW